MDITVAIIEDQRETREMLSALIGGSNGYYCAAAFENAEEAINKIPEILPDVVLVDINLPQQSGIECIIQLKDLCPGTQFIICSSFEDSENIFKALTAGAKGYLSKSTSPVKILEAISDVCQGGSPMSSEIARKVVDYFHQKAKDGKNVDLEKLTKREREILDYLSKGYRYKKIAEILFVSAETVRKHIHNIYQKLQVSSRAEALNKIYLKR
jgi:DNA-binding NarL/FixJ family response regulator